MTLQEYLTSLRHKTVAVIGIGVSNTPLLRRLLAEGIAVTACDRSSREKLGPLADELEAAGATLHLGEGYLDGLTQDVIFRTPGLRPDVPQLLAAQRQGSTLTSEMEVFFQVCPCHMIAVTGSDGKTTTTYLLKAILEQARGAKVGLIGTNQNMIGQEVIPTDRTTPESFEVQRLFREMADAGCAYAVMETSSHALCLDRVYGVHYAVGIFTNLTQDHLDFHVTMENYCDAKAILFRNCGVGVVNGDDPWTPRLLKDATCQVRTYGVKSEADLRAENVVLSADGIAFDAVTKTERVPIRVNIPGGFMVYNTLDVLGAALALGISLKDSAAVLAKVPHVQGRVEVVPTPGKDYTILIDYAHTPDSMVNVLQTVKEFAKGRTVAVFGCGGDRDKTKRPRMGKAAADWSDFAVVTTDNPRTEEPAAIIRDILPGFDGSNTPYEVVEDRVEAIRWAMDHAQKDDVIVLCGKGHETYQEVNHQKFHMDEREIVAEHLNSGR